MSDSPKSNICVEQNTGYIHRQRNRSQVSPMMAANKVQKIAELELQPEIKLTDNAPEWEQQIVHLISANHNALVQQLHTINISHETQILEIENLKKKT